MNQEYLEIAKQIAAELPQYGAKLVLLIGSVYDGKETPNDLDLGCVFEKENSLRDKDFREELIKKLNTRYGIKLDLIDLNQAFVEDLVDQFKEDPRGIAEDLAWKMMDSSRDQWMGWPLAWILGDNAEEALEPYRAFKVGHITLYGQEYLDELKERINIEEVMDKVRARAVSSS